MADYRHSVGKCQSTKSAMERICQRLGKQGPSCLELKCVSL